MTKKILFCLNADFTHFSIAYYLQQKLDCEFYALIDITNKPKKFFDSWINFVALLILPSQFDAISATIIAFMMMLWFLNH